MLGSGLLTGGGYEAFVWKLDRDGNFAWAQDFGGPGIDQGVSIALDSANNRLLARGPMGGESGTIHIGEGWTLDSFKLIQPAA